MFVLLIWSAPRVRWGIALFVLVALLLGAQWYFAPPSKAAGLVFGEAIPYQLDAPNQRFKLHHDLDEISGLSYLSEDTLLAVQDERGILFYLDRKSGEVLREKKFANSGDYEGVAATRIERYVLESDGDLYRVRDDRKTRKIETHLARENDTEGLAFDPTGGYLLIACKGKPGTEQKGQRAFYAFQLGDHEMAADPLFTLEESEVAALLGEEDLQFKPSGVARHPQSGHWYIIASVGKLLLVVDGAGALQSVYRLPTKLFKQPEGITFGPEGDLYISNEARDKGARATLLHFAPEAL